MDRSQYLGELFEKFVDKSDTVLEIGSGGGRNVDYLRAFGYNVEGIDKIRGQDIYEIEPKQYDVIYTMSTLFLLKDDSVFEKIASMAKKMIITLEGETTKENGVIGRDYSKVFAPFGFTQEFYKTNVFNEYGVARVLKR